MKRRYGAPSAGATMITQDGRRRRLIASFLVLLMAAGGLPLVEPASADRAELTETSLPEPYGHMGLAWDGDMAYLFGGWKSSGSAWADRIHHFDPANGTVELTTSHLPIGRMRAGAAWNGTHAFVFGGYNNSAPDNRLNDIVSYDPLTGDVTTMDARLPFREEGLTAIAIDETIYVMGGATSPRRVIVYDSVNDTLTSANVFSRDHAWATAAYDGRYIYVFGGYQQDRIERYDPLTNTATLMSAKLPGWRMYTSSFHTGNNFYVVGGWSTSTTYDQIVRFDPSTQTVTVMSEDLPSARYAQASFWDNGTGYMVGGRPLTDDIARYRFPPGPATSVSADSGNDGGDIDLVWEAPADNTHDGDPILAYRVYAGDVADELSLVAEVAGDAAKIFTESGLGDCTTRHYAVSAVNKYGEGPTSSTVSAVSSAPVNDWHFDFEGTDHCFTKEIDGAGHSIGWDAVEGNVAFTTSDTSTANEVYSKQFTRFYTPDADWTLTSRFRMEQLGEDAWTIPVFLTNGTVSDLMSDKSTLSLIVQAGDRTKLITEESPDPEWRILMRDECGNKVLDRRISIDTSNEVDVRFAWFAATSELEYSVDAGFISHPLTERVGLSLCADGFLFDKVGVASDGRGASDLDGGSPQEGWTDDLNGSGFANRLPVAKVGGDKNRKIYDVDGDGLVLVTLDGSPSFDPDGHIVRYRWVDAITEQVLYDGPDSLAEIQMGIPASASGQVAPYLHVYDGDGGMSEYSSFDNFYIYENTAPVAAFSASYQARDTDGDGIQAAFFDGTSSYDPTPGGGDVIAWNWYLDDVLVSVNTTFGADLEVGTHEVRLTVEDNGGLFDTETKTIDILPNRRPVASVAVDVCRALACTYDASASYDPDGSPLTFDWDFGDGTLLDDGASVESHTYGSGVWQEACVTVLDTNLTDTACDAASPYYYEDFDLDLGAGAGDGFTHTRDVSGQKPSWRVRTACDSGRTEKSPLLSFTDPRTCKYANGLDPSGGKATVRVGVPSAGAENASLVFDHRWGIDKTDVPTGLDQKVDEMRIELCLEATCSSDDWGVFRVWTASTDNPGGWNTCSLDLSGLLVDTGATIGVRFVFTANGVADNGIGWHVDTVSVVPEASTGCGGSSGEGNFQLQQ